MQIIIREIDQHSLQYVDQFDSTFMVESKLVLHAENGKISYTVVPAPLYEKHYPPHSLDYSAYVDNPNRAIFFAYVDEERAGQIRLLEYWNAYAYIDDITVAPRYRQQGVGRALMEQAIQWAKAKGCPGLMLETQSNNVPACRLYESCGFELGGFDRNLYRGLNPAADEIALYWYLIF